MKRIATGIGCMVVLTCLTVSQDSVKPNQKLRQIYSSKVGFYQPSDGLNNGLMVGVDGITEFLHYDFFLSGSAELYPKSTIAIFKQPEPRVNQQDMILLPVHVNGAYKVFDAPEADTRVYLGAGAGYYFYFYRVDYQTSSSGGGLLGGGGLSLTSYSESKNGGNVFGTLFARALIGQIFLEPRVYFASAREENMQGDLKIRINPSGFAITLGFQTK